MRSILTCLLFCITLAATAQQQTTSSEQLTTGPMSAAELSKTPGDFLKGDPPAGPGLTGFYNEIPPELEPAVRMAAEDNYSSSTPALVELLSKKTDPKERARILMWLGITNAQQAMDYEAAEGIYGIASSATAHLREAIKIDSEVFKASDVARTMGTLIASGWSDVSPEAELEKVVAKAEKERDPLQYYYAGIMVQRLAQRSYGYADTRVEDQKALGYFARSVAMNASRYETWPSYLNVVARLGMLDLMMADGDKMFNYFKNLRAPLFADQGPAALYLKTRYEVPPDVAEGFTREIQAMRPDDPFPAFTAAQIAMGTTPTLGIERFKTFLSDIDAGKIKLMPREQGYRISALYKLAFLQKEAGQLDDALATYEKVRTINPRYAEIMYNVAETYHKMADRETTGPKKISFLERAENMAARQQKVDYMGRAAGRSDGYRRSISRELRRVKSELGMLKKPGETTIPQPSKPLNIEM